MQLAQETGNRSVYARCLCSLADICRELGESEAKETLTVSHQNFLSLLDSYIYIFFLH